MIEPKDVMYVRAQTGFSIKVAKAAAYLLDKMGLDIYSDEAAATMQMRHFYEKAYRFSQWLEMKELINEFGSLED